MKIEASILQTTGSPQLTPRAAQAVAVAKARAASFAPAQSGDANRHLPTKLPDSLTARVALSVDKESGLVIGTVIDRDSGKVLRQIPSEEMVRLIRAAREEFGPLVDIKS